MQSKDASTCFLASNHDQQSKNIYFKHQTSSCYSTSVSMTECSSASSSSTLWPALMRGSLKWFQQIFLWECWNVLEMGVFWGLTCFSRRRGTLQLIAIYLYNILKCLLIPIIKTEAASFVKTKVFCLVGGSQFNTPCQIQNIWKQEIGYLSIILVNFGKTIKD